MFGDSVQSSPVNTVGRQQGGSLASLYQARKANDSATVEQIKQQFQKQIEQMMQVCGEDGALFYSTKNIYTHKKIFDAGIPETRVGGGAEQLGSPAGAASPVFPGAGGAQAKTSPSGHGLSSRRAAAAARRTSLRGAAAAGRRGGKHRAGKVVPGGAERGAEADREDVRGL